MTRGGAGKTILLTASLILSACASQTENVKFRPIGDVRTPAGSTSDQVAYGRAQLALGGTGLALEAFRKALRQRPDDAGALRGLGDAYAAMGRRDLARRYYEEALAIAPQDPNLLQAVGAMAVAPPSPVTPGPIDMTQPQPSLRPDQKPTSPPATEQAARLARSATANVGAQRGASPSLSQVATAAASAPPNLTPAPSERSIRVKLQPTRLYRPAIPDQALTPRLERLSAGEVALVTTAKRIWQALTAPRSMVPTLVGVAPRRSSTAQVPIRLLNAARYRGLAARTRRLLVGDGWRRLQIGDARKVHATSVILYPSGSESAARVLAAKLAVRKISLARGGTIVVLLGQDSARAPARQFRA